MENVLIAVFDLSNKRILLTYYFDGTDAGGSIMERTLAPNQLWKAVCLIKVQILFAREVQIVKTPISFWTRSMRKLFSWSSSGYFDASKNFRSNVAEIPHQDPDQKEKYSCQMFNTKKPK